MNEFPSINLSDYAYNLPQDLIAKRPEADRAKSKLLHYVKGRINHHSFSDILTLIPTRSTIFLNNTKVIPARLFFKRESGAQIEVFLLEPLSDRKLEIVMQSRMSCEWKCMIGNLKKWKEDEIISVDTGSSKLYAQLLDRGKMHVALTWDDSIPFSTILTDIGNVPLPPYIDRDADKEDIERYQTVYSEIEGAVAAPTAGLHFTSSILNELGKHHIIEPLTLHVGAGTFQPILTNSVDKHLMHSEKIILTRKNIENIKNSKFSVAVGTTSMRTLESTYWFGVKLKRDQNASFFIEQNFPYYNEQTLSVEASMDCILHFMDTLGTDTIHGVTEIFIVPGYQFKIVDGLITNYHLPGSTLILLVAAFIGEDWRKVYHEAQTNKYRFLSYGDSSYLVP